MYMDQIYILRMDESQRFLFGQLLATIISMTAGVTSKGMNTSWMIDILCIA